MFWCFSRTANRLPSTTVRNVGQQIFNLFSSAPRIAALAHQVLFFLVFFSLNIFRVLGPSRRVYSQHWLRFAHPFIHTIPVCLTHKTSIVRYNPAVFFVEIIDERLIHCVCGCVYAEKFIENCPISRTHKRTLHHSFRNHYALGTK